MENVINKQPSVRQINGHLSSMTGYCVVYGVTWQMRISRARTRNGVKEGRVINFNGNIGREIRDWESIPDHATVELT